MAIIERLKAARDALVTSFFFADPPLPIVSARRTDAQDIAENPEVAIVRASEGADHPSELTRQVLAFRSHIKLTMASIQRN